MKYKIPTLPIENIETLKILKKAISANKVIAELKGLAKTIPNQEILISTLLLQESKDSSEVENIVTTHDEIFKENEKLALFSPSAKEVIMYREALYFGFNELKNKPLTSNLLVKIVKILTGRSSGFRNMPGTSLKNTKGEVVYTPPQDLKSISDYMKNLEQFINDQDMSDLDPLIKMAIIHNQFESIHPFFDGNGRTGRILNILFLISSDILDIPILYLSRYIIQNKADYYRLLQKVRDENTWEEWILYILDALESTALQTIKTINGIKKLMKSYKENIKNNESKIYSHELINTIFSHPYTKIEFIIKNTGVTRVTASRHLKKLVDLGLLDFEKQKNTNYYINTKLLKLFTSL